MWTSMKPLVLMAGNGTFSFSISTTRENRSASFRVPTVTSTEHSLLLGTDDFVASFPQHLAKAIANTSERAFGFRIRPSQVREALTRLIFERPTDHLTKLNIIMSVLKRPAFLSLNLSGPQLI